MSKAISLFDQLQNISNDKNDIGLEGFDPFMINRFLSMNYDTVMFSAMAGELQNLPPLAVQEFYMLSLRKRIRYFKYYKGTKDKNIEYVASFYDVSCKVAEDYMRYLTNEEVDDIVSTNKRMKGELK